MLHASETWPLTKPNLQRNDRAMIRQICNVRPQDIVTTRSNELLVRLGIEDLLKKNKFHGTVLCLIALNDLSDRVYVWCASGAVVMFPDSEGLGAAVIAGVGSSLTQSSGISYFSLYTFF